MAPRRFPPRRNGIAKDGTTSAPKQALAAKVDDHVEIAVEAEDGAKFKMRASAEQLDALTGDLEAILDGDDAGAA